MKNYTRLGLVALVLLASTTWVAAQNVVVNTTKKYPNITQIEVESGWLDVSYVGGSSAEVAVEAYLTSNVTDQDIVFVTVGDVLKISYKHGTGKYNWNTIRAFLYSKTLQFLHMFRIHYVKKCTYTSGANIFYDFIGYTSS